MTTEAFEGGNTPTFQRRLASARLVTRLAMVAERLWPLVLPFLVLTCLFTAASWFGLFRVISSQAHAGLGVMFGLLAIWSLVPLRRFRKPTPEEIDRRIEAANRLDHQPVQVQTDELGGKPDLFADALWREHQARMSAKLRNLASDAPRAHVPERDPWGLRAIAPLLLVVAAAFSYGPYGGRIGDAFTATPGVPPVPPRIDAWVTPPAYTGKPPIFLTADTNRDSAGFTVPAGSDLVLRITGGGGDETASYEDEDGNTRDLAPTETEAAAQAAKPDQPRQFSGKLVHDGVLSLKSGDEELHSWAFTVVPDTPPTIAFSKEPKRAASGALELNYEIKDDYGATSAKADIALADPPAADAHPLYPAPDLPLSLPRHGAKAPAARTTRDLSEHVWAGARIAMTLEAIDAAKQQARSETRTFTLPERTFVNPLAKALVEQRRILGLDANRKPWVLDLMDAITLRPEDTIDSMPAYLGIMTARSRLKLASTDDELRNVADYLWEVALGIENGSMSTAEKKLRQAQEQLRQALERGASDEEIDKLMKELRQAMDDYLREFAERAKKDPNFARDMPENGREIRKGDIDKMLDQLEDMAKSGNRDQAQDLLSQLEDMMNSLQAGKPREGENGQQSEMRQQMNKLGEIMRRQQEMMNETFRMDRQQRGQRGQQGEDGQQGEQGQGEQGEQQGEGQPQPGQNGKPMTPEEFADAMKQLQDGQGQLENELEKLMDGLRGMGIQPGQGFGEAGREMGEAEGALGEQQGNRATGHQGRALEALRRGAQDMMQQMQQAMQGEQGGSEPGNRQDRNGRDPLDRPRATTGPDDGQTVEVPDEIDAQRARRILEAIRKRLGNALSPELERSYLERLLEMK